MCNGHVLPTHQYSIVMLGYSFAFRCIFACFVLRDDRAIIWLAYFIFDFVFQLQSLSYTCEQCTHPSTHLHISRLLANVDIFSRGTQSHLSAAIRCLAIIRVCLFLFGRFFFVRIYFHSFLLLLLLWRSLVFYVLTVVLDSICVCIVCMVSAHISGSKEFA